jgi:hypothetical protein
MAITLQQALSYSTSGDLVSTGGNQAPVSATLAGTLQASLTLNVGTSSHVLLTPSELATPGLCIIRYLGAANYVQIGLDSDNDGTGTFLPFARIYAGAPFPLSMPLDGSLKLYAKCNTAAADIFIQVYQR